MKIYLCWFLSILVVLPMVICLGKSDSSGAEPMPLNSDHFRVLTYNVFMGFRNAEKRRENAIAWIAKQQPDVVALQELNDYTEETLQDMAKMWNHPYSQLCEVKSGFHLGLTSREPLENVHPVTKEGIWHGLIHAQTFGIDFFVLHLAPKPEEIRLPETAIVLDIVKQLNSSEQPTILLGDFNSVSRTDAGYYQGTSASEIEFNVMDRYFNAGWVDLIHKYSVDMDELQTSFPSKLVENKWGNCRIDFILTSSDLAEKSRSAKVWKSPETHQLSDHYPILADFGWP